MWFSLEVFHFALILKIPIGVQKLFAKHNENKQRETYGL